MTEPAARTLARIEAAALAALDAAPDLSVDPNVLRFLLRAYVLGVLSADAGRLEAALGAAVDRSQRAVAVEEQAVWSMLLSDAAAVTTDQPLSTACARLLEQLDVEPAPKQIALAALVVEARLRAAAVLGDGGRLSSAVDALEALVTRTYQPGEALASIAEHASLASALVTAFDITGRIPYAMLAEELVQTAGRMRRHSEAGETAFEPACRLIGVLGRLARIHRDDDYQARAVVAPDADYAADAARLASSFEDQLPRGDALRSALLGLALLER